MSIPSATLPSTIALLPLMRMVYEERGTDLDAFLGELVAALDATRALVVRGDPRGSGYVAGGHAREGVFDDDALEDVDRSVLVRAYVEDRPVSIELGPRDAPGEIAGALAAPIGIGKESPAAVLYVELECSPRRLATLRAELMTTAAGLVSTLLDRTTRGSAPPPCDRAKRSRPSPPTLDELLAGPSFESIAFDIRAALRTDLPILLLGESGTGKTLLARAMAEASRRVPVVRIMLGSSDDVNTVASELFGHERGAFSGATARRTGLVEQADGGTLVLDELLNLPMHAQQLLLDFVQFGLFRPLGFAGREPKHADVRIIAATNGDPDRAVMEGSLRFDLYQRLGGMIVRLPPLRERRRAIVPLAMDALARAGGEWTLSRSARRALLGADLPWPGNVRELELMLGRARGRALAESPHANVIEPWHLGLAASPRRAVTREEMEIETDAPSPREEWARLHEQRARIDARERSILDDVMRRHGGVIAHVAKELGIPRTTLIGRLRPTTKRKTAPAHE